LIRRAARENVERRHEQERDTASRRAVRDNEERREQEQNIQNQRRRRDKNIDSSDWSKVITAFRNRVKEGPTNVCVCCGGLFFLKSIRKTSYQGLMEHCTHQFLHETLRLQHLDTSNVTLCSTCFNCIRYSKVKN